MSRRQFLKRTLPALAAGAIAGCARSGSGPAIHTKQQVRWRLVSTWPRSLDILYGGSEKLAERVSALTEGRFKIQPYQGGEIVPGLQVLDAVQQGTVEMGQSASYYFTGKNPALAFDTVVPFGLSARQHSAWLQYGGGIELLRKVFLDFNIINLQAGNTGAQMGGWFRREIGGIGDLAGLRMRIPGLGGEIMNRLGVNVQVLSPGEIYTSLERGAIDAAEWVGPYDDEKLGLHRVAKHYYYPGWWEPAGALTFYVNKNSWDALPSAYRDVLTIASHDVSQSVLAEYDAKNPGALARLKSEGVQVKPFSYEIMAAAQRESEAFLAEKAAGDSSYRTIHENWKTFRSATFDWFSTAELSYQSFAFPRVSK